MVFSFLPFGYGTPRSQRKTTRLGDVSWQVGNGMHLFRQFERDSQSAPSECNPVSARSDRANSSGNPPIVGGESKGQNKPIQTRSCRRASRYGKTQRRSRASPDVMHLEMILRPRRRAACRRRERKMKLRRADSYPDGNGRKVPLGHRPLKPKPVSPREAKRRTWFHRAIYARNWFPQYRNAENFLTRQKVRRWSKKTYRQCVKEAKLFKGAVHQLRRDKPGSTCRPKLVVPGEWRKILFSLRHRRNRRARRKGMLRKPVLIPLERENAVITVAVTDEASREGEFSPLTPSDDGTSPREMPMDDAPASVPEPLSGPDLSVKLSECPDCEGTSCSDWIRKGSSVLGCGWV